MHLHILIFLMSLISIFQASASYEETPPLEKRSISPAKEIKIEAPSDLLKYTDDQLKTSRITMSEKAQMDPLCVFRVLKCSSTGTCSLSSLNNIRGTNQEHTFEGINHLVINIFPDDPSGRKHPEDLRAINMFPNLVELTILCEVRCGEVVTLLLGDSFFDPIPKMHSLTLSRSKNFFMHTKPVERLHKLAIVSGAAYGNLRGFFPNLNNLSWSPEDSRLTTSINHLPSCHYITIGDESSGLDQNVHAASLDYLVELKPKVLKVSYLEGIHLTSDLLRNFQEAEKIEIGTLKTSLKDFLPCITEKTQELAIGTIAGYVDTEEFKSFIIEFEKNNTLNHLVINMIKLKQSTCERISSNDLNITIIEEDKINFSNYRIFKVTLTRKHHKNN